MPSPTGRYCSTHASGHTITGLLFIDHFQEGLLREAIHHLKYNRLKPLGPLLGRLLAKQLAKVELPPTTLVVPIPLHTSRQRQRGFNQSAELAQVLPYRYRPELLARQRFTPPQAELNREQRLVNLSGAFIVLTPSQVVDQTILLVDDVATTGATLDEAAKVLVAAGAKTVWAAVLAKD